ncbi:hypothetical protein [Piscinibacter sakaiensis]|uniref:hypothetical protein n=1 Tax=Piscinibacter sakaiensis TaxID=1547922 RepID=UPI003AAB97CA
MTYLDVARGDSFAAHGLVVRLGRGIALAEGQFVNQNGKAAPPHKATGVLWPSKGLNSSQPARRSALIERERRKDTPQDGITLMTRVKHAGRVNNIGTVVPILEHTGI